MPARLNHLAVFVAAIAYFVWGYLWYGLIFTKAWMALIGPIPMNSAPSTYIQSFIAGWIMAYCAGIALTKNEADQPARHGVEFGLFMGIGLIATAMYNGYLYTSKPLGLWAIDAGYCVSGLAIMSAIVSGWRKKVAA
jgi:hypothetical protein